MCFILSLKESSKWNERFHHQKNSARQFASWQSPLFSINSFIHFISYEQLLWQVNSKTCSQDRSQPGRAYKTFIFLLLEFYFFSTLENKTSCMSDQEEKENWIGITIYENFFPTFSLFLFTTQFAADYSEVFKKALQLHWWRFCH